MPKRKKKAKSVKRTTRGGVTQSVVINIGDKQKRRARSYLKPNRIQGHNLMIPQLISTRQDPFDLATVGKLQQRQTEQDNLMVRQFEEFRVNQQQQADDLEDAKQVARGLFATRQDKPIISEIQKTIDPPPRFIHKGTPEQAGQHLIIQDLNDTGYLLPQEKIDREAMERQSMAQEEAMTRQGMEQQAMTQEDKPTIKKKLSALSTRKTNLGKAEKAAREKGDKRTAEKLLKDINLIEKERQRLNSLLGKKSFPRRPLTPDDEGFVSQAAEEDD